MTEINKINRIQQYIYVISRTKIAGINLDTIYVTAIGPKTICKPDVKWKLDIIKYIKLESDVIIRVFSIHIDLALNIIVGF